MRLELNGAGSVKAFSALLSELARCYDLIEQFQLLCETVNREAGSNAREPVWQRLYFERYPFHQNLDEVLQSTSPFAMTLTVGSIRLESPGWMELIGSLNPLKVIADFITGCRAENTKRMAIRSNEAIQRDRIRAKFATDILKMLPERTRLEGVHRIVDITNGVIVPAALALESIASDERVEGALMLRDDSIDSEER
jgi:hypothetical protein